MPYNQISFGIDMGTVQHCLSWVETVWTVWSFEVADLGLLRRVATRISRGHRATKFNNLVNLLISVQGAPNFSTEGREEAGPITATAQLPDLSSYNS